MAELKIDGLSCGYGGEDIVRNVSMTVKGGETAAIAGPNGCGKKPCQPTLFDSLSDPF